jgi:tetratricopeptide (TPR) repeat protein
MLFDRLWQLLRSNSLTNLLYILAIVVSIIIFLRQRNAHKESEKRDARFRRQPFPFLSFFSNALSELYEKLVGPNASIKYVARSPNIKFPDLISRHKKVLVVGRTGIGKTREALEAIELLAREEADPVTVFTPSGRVGRPWADSIGTFAKRPVLFIDEIDKYYDVYDPESNERTGIDSFHGRLIESIKWFSDRSNRLRIIFTAEDESFFCRLTPEEQQFWADFEIINIPEIHETVLLSFIENVARATNLIIDTPTANYIKENCDATCKGIIDAFWRFREQNVDSVNLSLSEAKKLAFTWPIDWNTEVYEEKIAVDSNARRVFEALGILYFLRVEPFKSIVVNLASRLRSEYFHFIFRRQMRRRIENDLKPWLKISTNERINCQGAYLKDKGDVSASIPLIEKTFASLPLKDKEKLVANLYQISQRVTAVVKDHNAAASIIKALASGAVSELQLWDTLHILYADQNAYEKSVDAAKRLVEISGGSVVALHRLSFSYGKAAGVAVGQRKTNLHRLAIQAAQRAIEKDNEFASALKSLAINYGELGEHADSIVYSKRLTEVRGSSRDWYGLGVSFGKTGNHEDAVRAVRHSLTLNPKDIEAWRSLVINLSELGETEEELNALEELVKLSDSAEDWQQLSAVKGKLGNHEGAVAAATMALGIDEHNENAKKSLGLALANQGKYDEAKEYIDSQLVESIRKAHLYLKIDSKKEISRAVVVDYLREKIREQPENCDLWQVFGASLRKLGVEKRDKNGRPNEAVRCFENAIEAHMKAIRLSPQHISSYDMAAMWYAMGRAYQELNDMAEACQCYSKASHLDPMYQKSRDYFDKYCANS